MSDLIEKLKTWIPQRGLTLQTQVYYWLTAVAIAAFLAFYWDATRPELGKIKPEAENPLSASTYIPAGFVLVPIEVTNYESLDSILGKFGVVDLYRPSEKPGRPAIKVAEHIKILRAPLNPSHFAVLAPENDSRKLVAYSGPFTVVVQNPERVGTRFVKETPGEGRSSRITVEVSDAFEK